MVFQIFRARDQVERILAAGEWVRGRGKVICLSMSEEKARGLHVTGAPCGEGSRHVFLSMYVSALFSTSGCLGEVG